MSAESQIYAALSGALAVTGLVAERIYPDAIPEDKALPAIVFSRTGTEPYVTLAGVRFAEDVQYQVVSWAETRTAADAVGDAAEAALRAGGFTVTGRSAAFDGDIGLFATTIETTLFLTF